MFGKYLHGFRNTTMIPKLEYVGVSGIQNVFQPPQEPQNQRAKAAPLLSRQVVEKLWKQSSVKEAMSYASELVGNLVNTGQKLLSFPQNSTWHHYESTEAFNSYKSVILDRKKAGKFPVSKKLGSSVGSLIVYSLGKGFASFTAQGTLTEDDELCVLSQEAFL